MTHDEAKLEALRDIDGNAGLTWNRGFDAGWDSIAPEVIAVIEQLDALAEVWGDEGVFRRCRDRLKAAVGVEPGDGKDCETWSAKPCEP